uniref:Uncharacterized protein n=1 Tax=Anguilla anguilla TaxID=7936 RepID=A0A0E9QKB6_ANGAN
MCMLNWVPPKDIFKVFFAMSVYTVY